MFFMGGVSKQKVIKAFNPHIFFDDQAVHCEPAAEVAPTAIVPTDYKPGEVARPKEAGKTLANVQPGV